MSRPIKETRSPDRFLMSSPNKKGDEKMKAFMNFSELHPIINSATNCSSCNNKLEKKRGICSNCEKVFCHNCLDIHECNEHKDYFIIKEK